MAKKVKPLSARVSKAEYQEIARRQIEAQKKGIILDADEALADMKGEAKEAKQKKRAASRAERKASRAEHSYSASGTYLGGHPARDRQLRPTTLRISDSGIQVRIPLDRKPLIDEPWENITSLMADGPDAVQERFTATRLALFGPFALAMKKKKPSDSYVVVEGTFGVFMFNAETKSVHALRAGIAPWTARLKQGESESASPTTGRDRAEQLKDLADLRAQGVLTEAEFAAEKARILSD